MGVPASASAQTIWSRSPHRAYPAASTFDSVRINSFSPNVIRLHADLGADGCLVFQQSSYGWRVYSGYHALETFQVNGLTLAVPLVSGAHDLVFRYEGHIWPWYRWVVIALIIGLVVIATRISIISRKRKGAQHVSPSPMS
jgi:hypothetical protein